MDADKLLKSFETHLKVWNASDDTIKRYLATVKNFIQIVGVKETYTKQDFDKYMEALVERGTGGTYRRYVYSCLRSFYQISGFKLKLEKGNTPKADEPVRRWYKFDEMVKIMNAAKGESVRDWLIFRILPLSMSRRKGVTFLSRADYEPKAGTLMMPTVKNGRRILIKLDPETEAGLDSYLLGRTDLYTALFPSSRPSNRQGFMTPHQLNILLSKYAKLAGVEDKGVHAFRRGMATYYHSQGLDVREILELGDWKSEHTVLGYIQLDANFASQTREHLHPFFAREYNEERPPSKSNTTDA